MLVIKCNDDNDHCTTLYTSQNFSRAKHDLLLHVFKGTYYIFGYIINIMMPSIKQNTVQIPKEYRNKARLRSCHSITLKMSSRMGTKLFFPPNNIGSIHRQNEKFPHQPLTRGLAFTSLCKKLVRIPQRNIDLKSGVYALDTAAESPTSQYFRTAIVLLVSNPSFMEVTKTYDIVASKAFRQCSTKASLLRSVSN